jgi:excisionase family DNA binding protein
VTRSLLTAGEVAELLGVRVSWVYEQSRRGGIPTVTLGRYRRYRREAIEEWIVESELRAEVAGELHSRGRPRGRPGGARAYTEH